MDGLLRLVLKKVLQFLHNTFRPLIFFLFFTCIHTITKTENGLQSSSATNHTLKLLTTKSSAKAQTGRATPCVNRNLVSGCTTVGTRCTTNPQQIEILEIEHRQIFLSVYSLEQSFRVKYPYFWNYPNFLI